MTVVLVTPTQVTAMVARLSKDGRTWRHKGQLQNYSNFMGGMHVRWWVEVTLVATSSLGGGHVHLVLPMACSLKP